MTNLRLYILWLFIGTLDALTSDFSLPKFRLFSYGLTFHLHDKVVRFFYIKQKRRHYHGVTDVDLLNQPLEKQCRKSLYSH